MARYRHVLFVCTHDRDPDDPRGSCGSRGARELLKHLKGLTHEHGQVDTVRATSSGCLGMCARGCAVAVFSEEAPTAETWYCHVTPDDADVLFESHVLGGERFERLVDE